MKIIWTKLAKISFGDELKFIAKKWNHKEVENFMALVDNFTRQLETGIIQGKISQKTNIRL